MKLPIHLIVAAGLTALSSPWLANVAAADAPVTHAMIAPADMVWTDAPPMLPPGAQMTVLAGDPTQPGEFTIRLRVPANYRVGPHTHSMLEHLTVLSGVFYVGMGERAEVSRAREMPAGSFVVLPAGDPHFVFTRQETVVQVHGMGPFDISYLNPKDDPQTRP